MASLLLPDLNPSSNQFEAGVERFIASSLPEFASFAGTL
jgi:hypothetical protein